MTGTFVVLEGSAGTGKSALLDALAGELADRGFAVRTIHEFADAGIGAILAAELADGDRRQFRERALAHLATNLANVAYQAETTVAPVLDTHDVVLAERFVETTAVYSLPYVEERYDAALDSVVDAFRDALPVDPDLTVLLTLDDAARRERFERHRPDLLDDGEVPDRFAERQRRYLELLADRPDVLIYENDGDRADAVPDVARAIADCHAGR